MASWLWPGRPNARGPGESEAAPGDTEEEEEESAGWRLRGALKPAGEDCTASLSLADLLAQQLACAQQVVLASHELSQRLTTVIPSSEPSLLHGQPLDTPTRPASFRHAFRGEAAAADGFRQHSAGLTAGRHFLSPAPSLAAACLRVDPQRQGYLPPQQLPQPAVGNDAGPPALWPHFREDREAPPSLQQRQRMPPVRRRRYSTGTIQELAEPLLRAAPASLAATALPRDCEAREGRRHSWGSSSGLESVAGDFRREGSAASDSTLSPVVRKDLRKQAKAKRKALFPDPEKVKEEVRSAVCDVYDVETLYTRDGFWQALARSNVFKNVTFLVIALNSLWIAIDTDFNRSDVLSQSPWEFQAAENLFCAFFSFEIFVRFKAFRRKRDAFGDFWFVFDGFLASVMATCTWIEPLLFYFGVLATDDASAVMQNASMFRLLRLFRLSRVARLARLLKDVPELMVLIKGMASATRAVFSTLCLLVLVIYVFAIVFTQTMTGTQAAEGCFENVLQSMNCLLLNGVFADQAALISKLLDEHWTYYVTILVYMVIGSLTVLNMLIGVMCEVVKVVSEAEKDVIRTQNLKEKIGKILSFADKDHDKMITIEEFRLLLQSQDAMQALAEMKIHVVELVDFVDCIFDDKQALPFSAFVDTILQFRSDNTATVKDLLDTRRVLLAEVDCMLQEVAPSK